MCSFSEKELAEFHQQLESTFPFDDPARVRKGITYAGKQPDDDVWVLNKNLQIDGDGTQIAESQSK